eukprot:6305349-Ditylum_brightwellii.AAC.1
MMQRQINPDVETCTLDNNIVDEEQFVELDKQLDSVTFIGQLFGGIFKDETHAKDSITHWPGTDPDSNINCFPRSGSGQKWCIPKRHFVVM